MRKGETRHLNLIIKGQPKSAKRAAARRGIPVKNCRAINARETACAAPAHAHARVAAWLDTGSVREGRGYEPGTLLYFNGARGRGRKRRRR